MNTTVTTTIWMNEENIQKFIELYGEGDGKFSLSLVIPEPKEWTEDMFSGNNPDWHKNCCIREEWRLENWGTSPGVMDYYGDGLELRGILSGKLCFQTSNTLPVKVFEKMAADGLEFKIDLEKKILEDGSGKAKKGKFQYSFDSDYDGKGNCALPVKKLLESEKGLSEWELASFDINRHNSRTEGNLIVSDITTALKTNDGESLRIFNEKGEKGNLLDFDHSEPDKDGYVYYRVPESDLKVVGAHLHFTEEAKEKWLKKFTQHQR